MTTSLRLMAACLSLAAASAMVCTDTTCATVRCAGVTAESCLGGTFVKNGGFCGCCDACIRSLNKGEHCLATLLMGVPSTQRCGAGLYCDPRTSHCESLPDLTTLGKRETQTCAESKLTAENGPHLLGAFVPECETDGSFSAKQCRGSQCYCADVASGLPILSYMVNRWEAADMDCQCARDQAAYMKTGLIGKLFFCTASGSYKTHQTNKRAAQTCAEALLSAQNGPHLLGVSLPACETDGSYSAKQCRGSQCYCADAASGLPILSYMVNRWEAADMDCQCARDQAAYMKTGLIGKLFFCTDSGSYKTHQTNKRAAQTCAESLLSAQNGPHLLGASLPACKTDGSYSAKQCRGSQCYCADAASGRPILSYTVNRWEAADMDCQCARDQAAYMKTGLIGKLFFCTASGSYKTQPTPQADRAAAVSCADRVQQINAANTNGMPILGQFIPQCEQDGTYSPRQCHGSMCYCTDSLGAKLGSYSGSIGSSMDCKCARDEAEYASAGLLGKSFRCDDAGSYARYACTGSVCYCADATGQMKPGSPQVNVGNIGDLSC